MVRRLSLELTGVVFICCVLAMYAGGCSSTRSVTAVPEGLDLSKVPEVKIEMTAERFHFTPEEIHVKAGSLVRLSIRSINGTHGFALDAFGIDQTIREGEPKEIQFYAREKGEFGFHCSHFCGIGHFWMGGTIFVE